MNLPDGLVARPLQPEDAAAVTAVMAAQEIVDTGEVVIEEADIVGDWQRPSFDIAASTIGVFDGDRLVGYAEVSGGDRGDAAVDPGWRGRGIGTALALWMQDLARKRGATVIGMPVPEGSAGERLLAALGYRPRWYSWVLRLPEGAVVDAQPLPDGYALGLAESDDDRRATYEMIEDAFLEWSVRDRQSYEDFTAQVFLRPGFEAWHLRVVRDPAGAIVGAAYVMVDSTACGYVDKLAVRGDQRGRGLARALLADSFAAAREHGATISELSTDSRTGALSLYEKVGMQVHSTWVNMAIDV